MTDRSEWQAMNQRYLSLSLEWLRSRLLGKAGEDSKAEIAQLEIAAEISEMERSSALPALAMLVHQFGMSPFEKQLLLLCCAVEYDTTISTACAAAQGNPLCAYPTFSLGLSLLDEPVWDVVAPERPLRYWQMIEIRSNENLPLVSRQLRADDRIVNYVRGLNHLDARLLPYVKRIEIEPSTLPPSHVAIVDYAEAETRGFLEDSNFARSITLQLAGIDRDGKRDILGQLCRRLGLQLFELRAHLLPQAPTELDQLARLWRRESSLLPVCLFVPLADELHQLQHSTTLAHFLDLAGSVACLEVTEPIELHDQSVVVEVHKPTYGEQTAIWRESLVTSKNTEVIGQLASQFHLSAKTIRKVFTSKSYR